MEIRIDRDRCNQCLLCVSECVSGVIRDVDGAPAVVAPLMCNRCSHCLAVCPKNAIEHDALDPSQVRSVQPKLFSPEAYAEIVRSRRSVRHFKDQPVDKALLEQILDLARCSPTASNTQHVEYIVITDKEVIQTLAGRLFSYGARFSRWIRTPTGRVVYGALDKAAPKLALGRYVEGMEYYQELVDNGRDIILHHAPVLLLACAPGRAPFACDNCNIAAANITNYAHSLGLGTCYIGFLTLALRLNPALRRMAGVPKGKKAFVSLVMGHPAHRFKSVTSRKKPEVHWIGAN